MPHTRNPRKRRRRPSGPAEQVAIEIQGLRARAAQVGIPFSGDEKLEAFFPQARCTTEERERAQQLADEAGISLSEHIRRSAIAAPRFSVDR